MNRKTRFMGSSALALTLMAGSVQADVTPQQVWQDLEVYFQSFGYTVAATQSQSGDVLTVTGFEISMEMPDNEGTMRFSADPVVLRGLGDGRVSVDFPNVMPISMQFSAPDEDPFEAVINYTHDGLAMIVSGTPDDITYDYTADELGLTLTELEVDGEVLGRDVARGEVLLTGVVGQSVVKYGDLRDISQTMTMAEMRYDIAFNDPDSDDAGLFSGILGGLGFSGAATYPPDLDMSDPEALGTADLTGSGRFSYTKGESQFAVTEDGDSTTGQTSSDGSSLTVGFTGDAITYAQTGTNIQVSMTGGELPIPVTVAMAETAFNLIMPVTEATEPQEVALGLTLGGFTMSDLLWNMADPGKALPRDPATVSVDVVGLVTPFLNIFDPEAMESLDDTDGVPGELNALTLKNLMVDVAGARLTGTGDFTFDNTDLETYDGMPRPEGQVNLQLVGANALIDKLIVMGLLDEQDAMGARMMMSMFTVPGSAPDQITSKLEFNNEGHILANGQRIK